MLPESKAIIVAVSLFFLFVLGVCYMVHVERMSSCW